MAKFHFKAGEAFEILTPEEHRAEIDRVVAMLARSQRPPNTVDRPSTKSTDTNGVLAKHVLFRIPVGMVAVLHRINIEGGTYTRAAPLSSSGYINFALDSNDAEHTFEGIPEPGQTQVVPYTIAKSVSAAKIGKGGQEFLAYGASLPVSTAFYFNCQILLWETEG